MHHVLLCAYHGSINSGIQLGRKIPDVKRQISSVMREQNVQFRNKTCLCIIGILNRSAPSVS